MRFNILGSSSGLPEKNKNLSSIFVECHSIQFLIDCGEGVAHRIQELSLDHNELDIVAITHFHPDHISGFFMLIQTLYLQKRNKKLHVYLPERIDDFTNILDLFYTFRGRLSFELIFKPFSDLSKDFFFIDISRNDHLQNYESYIEENSLKNEMNSYSIRFNENQKSLLYTSDINSTKSINNMFQNLQICIIDTIHPNPSDINALKDVINEKIYLTHGFSPELHDMIKGIEIFEYAQENLFIQL